MGNTSLILMPIPDEYEDPFISTTNDPAGTFGFLDTWLQALREDADLSIVENGAPWTLDDPTNTVTWGSNIVLYSATNGGTITIAASSIVCADPGVLYVTVPSRPISGANVLTMSTAATKTALALNEIMVAIRYGSQVILRNSANLSPNIYTYAGNPNGNVVASKIGDQCVDTVNSLTYVAYAADSTHWQIG